MADTLCSSSSSSSSYNLKKNPNFQPITCIILHDLSLLYSFITSHPLYFSYFIFFSRYLIKLIPFISPPFIATVFLSLLLTTTTAFCHKLPQLQLSILQTVIIQLNSNLNEVNEGENDHNFEDFEIYKIVFHDTLSISNHSEGDEDLITKKILEHSVDCDWRNDCRTNCSDLDELGFEKLSEMSLHGGLRNEATISNTDSDALGVEKPPENSVHGGRRNEAIISNTDSDEVSAENTPENSVHGGRRFNVTVTDSDEDELEKRKSFEKLLIELDRFDDFTTATETNAKTDEVIGELRKPKADPVEFCKCSSDDDKFSQNSVRSSSWRSNSSSVVTSDGWRKTLACKPFEERHNSRGGEEGMDSLWEAYENDNSKNRKDVMVKNKVMMMMMMMMKMSSNNGGIQRFEDDDDDDDNEGDEDDDLEMSNGHLCCLQALKLSTKKMNMGLGKPNLVKISKALKGFGWLHRVKNKHGGKTC